MWQWLQTAWTMADVLTTLAGVVAAGFSIAAWLQTTELLKSNRETKAMKSALISIILRASFPNAEIKTVELPVKPRRDQLTRGEFLGIIGMFGDKRFEPTAFRKCIESGHFYQILAGEIPGADRDRLYVDCTGDIYESIRCAVQQT